MPFRFEFFIDTEKLNGVEIGFSTSRKWEEALDEARLVIPFSYLNKTPYKMYSLLTIKISEFDTYAQVLPNETRDTYYLVYSDHVAPVGAYGYYKHTVSGIEYTVKLDVYIVNYLAQSRSIIDDTPARFQLNTDIILNHSDDKTVEMRANLEPIDIKATYRANEIISFPQVAQAYWKTTGYPSGYGRCDAVIKTNATLVSGTSPHTLSIGVANWVFPVGQWYIEYGFNIPYNSEYYNAGYYFLYRYYINVIDEHELSVYDVINEIRTCVSKYGGIEDEVYFDSTRIFDIDTTIEDYLKSVQIPQIYLDKTTARKMLIYVLAFVNALPRLEWTDELDILTIEQYNLSTGSFTKADVIAHAAVQNTNQIGTRNYQHITQSLANDLDEASIYSPSQSGFQQVRSLELQITANNFSFHLPKEFPLYMPKHFYCKIPNIKITMLTGATTYTFLDVDDYELDLMPRFINGEYWKLKEPTANWPSIDATGMWHQDIGMRLNMVDNLSWNMGDTVINLSEVYGQLFESNLITNVVKEMAYEHFVTHLPGPITPTNVYGTVFQVAITIPSSTEYKDWKFRLEYITDERLVIKQDKEDLSQISFYSEMQQNQEESLVNILRQSRKGYGDLQRTGNVEFSFVKLHKKFSEFYEVGQVDSDKYTIAQIDTQWFNDYAIVKYHVTKHHNRIQQATYVNQKYRPFDNFAKSVLNRHEFYNDYLIAFRPNDPENTLQNQTTKIYSNGNTIHKIVEMMLGDYITQRGKASVALIRTDGMFSSSNPSPLTESSIYPNWNTNRYFILAPVSAKGIKGGFAFTFGFQGNQSAGDGLVQKGTNWYNRAVRYTDNLGRFTRFGFAIVKDFELDSNDSEIYPLVTMGASDYDNFIRDNAYFWCGSTVENKAYGRSLVWNKDPLTNTNLTHQLSVISFHMGLYIFGIDFYSKNFIVNNPEVSIPAYLYIYSNSTTYQIFEDIYVKSGYSSSVLLTTSNIEYDSSANWLKFIGISMVGKTSWAIGRPSEDGSIKLLVACNEALNGVQFVNQHFRPDVYEIGSKLPLIYWLDISSELEVNVNLEYVVGPSYQFDMNIALTNVVNLEYVVGPSYQFNIDTTLTVNTNFQHVLGASYQFDMNIALTNVVDLVYTPTYFQELSLDIPLTVNVSLLYFEGESVPINLSNDQIITVDLVFYKSDDFGTILDIPLTIGVDLMYGYNLNIDALDIPLTIVVDMQHSPTFNYELDIPLTVVAGMTIAWNMGLDLNIPLTTNVILTLTPTYFQELNLNIPLTVVVDLQHYTSGDYGLNMDIELTIGVNLLYSKAEFVTATPNIENESCSTADEGITFFVQWRVRNQDTSTVTIYTEANDTTPDLFVKTGIAPNALTDYVSQDGLSSITIYAKAKASDKQLSAYDRVIMDTAFCPLV